MRYEIKDTVDGNLVMELPDDYPGCFFKFTGLHFPDQQPEDTIDDSIDATFEYEIVNDYVPSDLFVFNTTLGKLVQQILTETISLSSEK